MGVICSCSRSSSVTSVSQPHATNAAPAAQNHASPSHAQAADKYAKQEEKLALPPASDAEQPSSPTEPAGDVAGDSTTEANQPNNEQPLPPKALSRHESSQEDVQLLMHNALKSSLFGECLKSSELTFLSSLCRLSRPSVGAVLIAQGKVPTSCFVVHRGEIAVWREQKNVQAMWQQWQHDSDMIQQSEKQHVEAASRRHSFNASRPQTPKKSKIHDNDATNNHTSTNSNNTHHNLGFAAPIDSRSDVAMDPRVDSLRKTSAPPSPSLPAATPPRHPSTHGPVVPHLAMHAALVPPHQNAQTSAPNSRRSTHHGNINSRRASPAAPTRATLSTRDNQTNGGGDWISSVKNQLSALAAPAQHRVESCPPSAAASRAASKQGSRVGTPRANDELFMAIKEKNDEFGHDLFFSRPSQLSYRVSVASVLIEIPKSAWNKLFDRFPHARRSVLHAFEYLEDALGNVRWLGTLSKNSLILFSSLFHSMPAPSSTVLFEEGELPHDQSVLYFIHDGSIELTVTDEKGNQAQKRVGKGTIVGEVSIMLGFAITASALTLSQCMFRVCRRRYVSYFLALFPEVGKAVRSFVLNNYYLPDAQLLSHPSFYHFFHKFCRKEFNGENLEFWRCAREFKNSFDNMTTEQQISEANYLYQRYVIETAIQQINIKQAVRVRITHAIERGSINREMFSEAEREIQHLMLQDTFPRFKASPLYTQAQEFLRPALPQPLMQGVINSVPALVRHRSPHHFSLPDNVDFVKKLSHTGMKEEFDGDMLMYGGRGKSELHTPSHSRRGDQEGGNSWLTPSFKPSHGGAAPKSYVLNTAARPKPTTIKLKSAAKRDEEKQKDDTQLSASPQPSPPSASHRLQLRNGVDSPSHSPMMKSRTPPRDAVTTDALADNFLNSNQPFDMNLMPTTSAYDEELDGEIAPPLGLLTYPARMSLRRASYNPSSLGINPHSASATPLTTSRRTTEHGANIANNVKLPGQVIMSENENENENENDIDDNGDDDKLEGGEQKEQQLLDTNDNDKNFTVFNPNE